MLTVVTKLEDCLMSQGVTYTKLVGLMMSLKRYEMARKSYRPTIYQQIPLFMTSSDRWVILTFVVETNIYEIIAFVALVKLSIKQNFG